MSRGGGWGGGGGREVRQIYGISLNLFLKLAVKLSESESESHSVVLDSLRPHELYSTQNSPCQNAGVGSISLLQGNLPNPEIEARSPTLQADSLAAKPQGKPL